jgi:hypothetical protein
MLRSLRRIVKRIARAVTALAKHLARRLCRAWKLHGQWVATDAVYAAVTATVLAGVLGLVPATDVVSAVFGVHMSHRQSQHRDTKRWSDDWDLA